MEGISAAPAAPKTTRESKDLSLLYSGGPNARCDPDRHDGNKSSTQGKVMRGPAPTSEPSIRRRRRIGNWGRWQDAAELLKNSSNIVVITGAGISTSLGIPDFRSPDGLQTRLRAEGRELQDVFGETLFEQDPTVLIKTLRTIKMPDLHALKYTPTHCFIRKVFEKGKLLRNYTQNIDDLEVAAGIPREKLEQVHGSLSTAKCQSCAKVVYDYPARLLKDELPRCEDCVAKRKQLEDAAQARERPRRSTAITANYQGQYSDVLKPGIVLYDGAISPSFYANKKRDAKKADLLLVIGTSLLVSPLNKLPRVEFRDIPQIFISKEPCDVLHTDIEPDIQLLGNCDVLTHLLAGKAGWAMKHEMLVDHTSGRFKIRPSPECGHIWSVQFQESLPKGSVSPRIQLNESPRKRVRTESKADEEDEISRLGSCGGQGPPRVRSATPGRTGSENPDRLGGGVQRGNDGPGKAAPPPRLPARGKEGELHREIILGVGPELKGDCGATA